MGRLDLRRLRREWGSRCRVHVFAAVKACSKRSGSLAPHHALVPVLGPQFVERFPSHLYLCQLDPLRKGGLHDPGIGFSRVPGAKAESRLDGLLHPEVDRSRVAFSRPAHMVAAVKALPAPGIAAPNRSAQPALIEERAAMLEAV